MSYTFDAEAESRRFAEQWVRPTRSEAHKTQVAKAWLEGFNAGGPNLENPYRRLNNFFAPQRRAWRAGHHKRLELDTAERFQPRSADLL